MSDSQTISEPFILFELAGTIYAMPTKVVQQMEMVERITPVPNAAPFVEGVVFSRGKVIPAINLRSRFGFEKIPYDARTRLIVIHTSNRTVGLIADTAREFVSIPKSAIQPPPEGISGLSGKYLSSIANLGDASSGQSQRMVLILNPDEVLNMTSTISPVAVGN
ncbi:MAG: chemotaxis protein CheW [Aulosira sp. ZfuVER01]|nr:chemotaxis protein CheW [Aulosira sp. ZfuVER01]MDZ7999100.1 chemotaxis protein CheW [Aulosira sp. DedVER01a]MDZ8051176.1 chemotaxis protein CheW [Aulosira sp. ZfuCHP01]